MNRVIPLLAFSILLLVPIGAQQVFAAQVQTSAQMDTFILNGGGPFGLAPIMTVSNNGISEEHTLVSFDLSSIPVGSTVTSVEVEMVSLGLSATPPIVTFHKVSSDWGEFEATWSIRLLLPTTSWGTAGGDFVSTPSVSKTVTTTGPNTFGNTAGMVQDVQSWVDSSSTNFGWLLKTNTIPGASVFSTKENTSSPSAIITVTFTPPGGEPEICDDLIDNDGDGFIDGNDPDCQTAPQLIGGEIIPIESTSILLAGAQSFSWMIPVVLSVLGIGLFVASRNSENS